MDGAEAAGHTRVNQQERKRNQLDGYLIEIGYRILLEMTIMIRVHFDTSTSPRPADAHLKNHDELTTRTKVRRSVGFVWFVEHLTVSAPFDVPRAVPFVERRRHDGAGTALLCCSDSEKNDDNDSRDQSVRQQHGQQQVEKRGDCRNTCCTEADRPELASPRHSVARLLGEGNMLVSEDVASHMASHSQVLPGGASAVRRGRNGGRMDGRPADAVFRNTEDQGRHYHYIRAALESSAGRRPPFSPGRASMNPCLLLLPVFLVSPSLEALGIRYQPRPGSRSVHRLPYTPRTFTHQINKLFKELRRPIITACPVLPSFPGPKGASDGGKCYGKARAARENCTGRTWRERHARPGGDSLRGSVVRRRARCGHCSHPTSQQQRQASAAPASLLCLPLAREARGRAPLGPPRPPTPALRRRPKRPIETPAVTASLRPSRRCVLRLREPPW